MAAVGARSRRPTSFSSDSTPWITECKSSYCYRILQTYLETLKCGIRAPETNIGDGWSNWTNKFIVDSKKLLTVRRNASGFQHLAERGATILKRKGSVEVHLENYDIAADDPWNHFRQKHENLSVEFVTEYIKRSGETELLERVDDGKRVFANRL